MDNVIRWNITSFDTYKRDDEKFYDSLIDLFTGNFWKIDEKKSATTQINDAFDVAQNGPCSTNRKPNFWD